MSAATDDHDAWLAWHTLVQDRLDAEAEPDAEACYGTCAHRDACTRALMAARDGHVPRMPWSVIECDECSEWEMRDE